MCDACNNGGNVVVYPLECYSSIGFSMIKESMKNLVSNEHVQHSRIWIDNECFVFLVTFFFVPIIV